MKKFNLLTLNIYHLQLNFSVFNLSTRDNVIYWMFLVACTSGMNSTCTQLCFSPTISVQVLWFYEAPFREIELGPVSQPRISSAGHRLFR